MSHAGRHDKGAGRLSKRAKGEGSEDEGCAAGGECIAGRNRGRGGRCNAVSGRHGGGFARRKEALYE